MKKILLISAIFLFGNSSLDGPKSMAKKILNPPPKIIRTCCSFGSDLSINFVPFKKMTDITELEEVGAHVYLGDKQEGNGIIYTKKGGFVDLGHLRDIADWTAYLYRQININKGKIATIALGREGGKKILYLDIPTEISTEKASLLAGQIAYDLSNWHEIGTWFGTSFIPFVPERYSAFSPEDQYSNLLGANIGIEALQSNRPFEESMTNLIDEMLTDLEAVQTREKTYDAMESVVDDWWTRENKLPSSKVLIKRYVTAANTLKPWLVSKEEAGSRIIHTPAFYDNTLSKMYELRFDLNRKFPLKEIFPEKKDRCITQDDFPIMIDFISTQTDLLEFEVLQDLEKKVERKEKQAARKARRRGSR